MEELTKILAEATRAIAPGYFYLNIDGGDPIYRERVYCYELYHQMRLRWPDGCPFYLNGEIDKSAHPILSELGVRYSKPDLLVHTPGYMSGNHAIIEVKPDRATPAGVRKDIETLSIFLHKVGYRRAIYLIYGNAVDRLIRYIDRAATLAPEKFGPIELWAHREPGSPAEIVKTLG